MAKYKNYSNEEKRQALELMREGMSVREIATMIGAQENTIRRWRRLASKPCPISEKPEPKINPLLLQMAAGNDLTPFVGKEITRMQPREIYAFLRALNVKGDLIITQKVKL